MAKISTGEILLKGDGLNSIPMRKFLQTLSDDYIRTYVEKDIILSPVFKKHHDFIRFAKLLAEDRGILLIILLAREVGVNAETIREWISFYSR